MLEGKKNKNGMGFLANAGFRDIDVVRCGFVAGQLNTYYEVTNYIASSIAVAVMKNVVMIRCNLL